MAKKRKIEKIEYKNEDERREYLKKTMQEINKRYGNTVLHYGTDVKEYEKVPFGIPELDNILDGGIVKGLFTTLWGGSGVGKTTLAYYLTVQAQKLGKIVYYIALEPFDKERAKQFGVDVDKLILGQFPIAEQSLDSIIEFAEKKLVDVIILDSLHSLSPKLEQQEKRGKKKSVEADSMALLARKLSQFFRMAIHSINKAKIAVLLIGQTRTDLGGFIPMQRLAGGRSLHHNSRLILHIRKGNKADAPTDKVKCDIIDEEGFEKTKTTTQIVGFDCVIKIQKTQITGTKPENTEIHIPFYYNGGFTKIEETTNKPVEKTVEENKIEEPIKKRRGRPKKEV